MSAMPVGGNGIGMPRTATAEVLKQGQILRALGDLGDSLARTQDRINNLRGRLEGVMSPIPPTNAKNPEALRSGSEIANRVDGYSDFVNQLDEQISEIISRLEI